MVRVACLCFQLVLFTLILSPLVHGQPAQSRPRKRPNRQHDHRSPSPPSTPPSPQPPSSPSRLLRVRKHPPHPTKRGVPGLPGDIEWMGFYGSLLAVPTMLSILGIQTNYNLEKSYFNSQLNAQYYKQSRELLRAHAAKLTRNQEEKFAKAGVTWPGMMYDKDGQVRGEWGGSGGEIERVAESGQNGGGAGRGGGAGKGEAGKGIVRGGAVSVMTKGGGATGSGAGGVGGRSGS